MSSVKPSTPPWAYALGEFGLSLPSQVVGTYLTFFFTEQLGMAVLYLALARGINTVWDIVNDPLMGYWSDKTRHPRGRRWPWLRAGLPLYVLLMAPLWLGQQGWGQLELFFYMLAGLLLFETVTTVVYLNHNALFPALYQDEPTRVQVNTLRRVAGLLGLFVTTSLSPLLFERLGVWGLVGIWGGMAAVCLGLYFSRLHEPPFEAKAAAPDFWHNLLDTLRNPGFAPMLMVVMLVQVAVGSVSSGVPFFAKYVLKIPNEQTGLLFAAVLGTALVTAFVWPSLSGRLGLINSWQLALALFVVALVPMWTVENLTGTLIFAIPLGLGVGGVVVLQDVVLARIIDRDAERSGQRREGAIYGSAAVLIKLSGLLVNLIFASLTPLFGFVSGDQPGPNTELAFRFLLAGPPVVALVLAFALAGWLKRRI